MRASSRPSSRQTLTSARRPLNRSSARGSVGTDRRDTATWLIAAALLIATLAAYQPAWRGGMLWDDDKHITSAELQPVSGLARIWFDLGATQQYYPVVHSAFWIQHRLWGEATLGYHLVNIFLHVCSAWLLLVILRRLAVPGAVLAAVIFALHPVHVESVAWITELKNTLSGVFYLLSALAYLRDDRERTRGVYAASLGLFVLALLSKSVTATLPGVLLVVIWWQRGRLGWRRDIVPLLPWFVIGASASLFTAWVERTFIGAEGGEFNFTLIERILMAGRVIWFYLGKLVWPVDLAFVYPRWQVSQSVAWQYAYPLGVAALLAACWLVRRRSRAPLAALLAFGGTLLPVLGFFNVYPFRFSLVADHFQYLASVPVIVLLSAGATTLADRWIPRRRWVSVGATLAVAATLGGLTWHQSQQYGDALTLYRATLRLNPSCWLAHGNLGALLRTSDPDQALVHLTEAVRLKPDLAEAHYNLANVLQQTGRSDEAVREYHEAIRLSPALALAHYNLGNTYQDMGRLDQARQAYEHALQLSPGLALAHSALGRVLQAMGRPDDARRECERAVGLDPDLAVARYDLAGVLQEQDRLEDAVAQYTAAARLRPGSAEIQNDLGSALQQLGRFEEARAHFEDAVRLSPATALVHSGLCGALQMLGRLDQARRSCETAVELQPDLAVGRYDLANVLQQQGRLDEAVAQYLAALRLEPDAAEVHYNLATALQGLGRAADAREHFDLALRLVPSEAAAYSSRGAALEAQGRLQDARRAYEQALRLAPDSVTGRQNLARVDAALRLLPAADKPRPAGDAR